MGLILLEALLAGCLFIFIVWWTMFSGRPRGEPPGSAGDKQPDADSSPDPAETQSATGEKP
jgi:hypothetical protein